MAKFEVNPILQKHQRKDIDKNTQAVMDSEIFFIFGDEAYIKGCKKPYSETIKLISLAKRLNKPFILCIDKNLSIADQIYLRNLCPTEKTQVFSFNPKLYDGMQLHNKIMTILNSAINHEVIVDPFIN